MAGQMFIGNPYVTAAITQSSQKNEKVAQLEEANKCLRETNALLREEIVKSVRDIASLQEKSENDDDLIAELEYKLNVANRTIKEQMDQISELNSEIEDYELMLTDEDDDIQIDDMDDDECDEDEKCVCFECEVRDRFESLNSRIELLETKVNKTYYDSNYLTCGSYPAR